MTTSNADLDSLNVNEMRAEAEKLRAAIRKHMNEEGDERCHESDHDLYEMLPEGDQSNTDLGCTEECWIMRCRRYFRLRQNSPSSRPFSSEIYDHSANLSRKWEEMLLYAAVRKASLSGEDLRPEHLDAVAPFINLTNNA